MARITVEDCLLQLNNRFQLVMLASQRARDLARGAEEPGVAWENDKPTVVALREIADGHVKLDYLKKQTDKVAVAAELVAAVEPSPSAALPLPTDQPEAP